jgi:uncharacterized protein YcfJ
MEVMDNFKRLIYKLLVLYLIGVIFWLALIVPADAKHWSSGQPYNVILEDVYEWRYTTDKHSVEKCQVIYKENKTNGENAIKGALLGAIIGNLISDGDNTATTGGAVFGALAGANVDPIEGVKKKKCTYEKKKVEVYSHSVIKFWLSGKKYELRFYK